jgi:hypothetical protein
MKFGYLRGGPTSTAGFAVCRSPVSSNVMPQEVKVPNLLSLLEKFSASLGNSYPYDDTARYYKDCWKEVPGWIAAAEENFLSAYRHQGIVKSVQLILNDPFFKQSASAVVMFFGVLEDDDLKIRLECLIDHSSSIITVVKRPRQANPELERLSELIEKIGWGKKAA